jgi:uncharacterized Zn finger protein (UPF0148 family)
MKQTHLYKCEQCGVARFSEVDKGIVWCTMCQECKLSQFHEKIVIRGKYDMFGNFKEDVFVIEENKYDNAGSKEAGKKE